MLVKSYHPEGQGMSGSHVSQNFACLGNWMKYFMEMSFVNVSSSFNKQSVGGYCVLGPEQIVANTTPAELPCQYS